MLATRRGSAHYPSMLEDVEARRPTEIDLITGSLVREAQRLGVPVPLHTAMYRLVKAKEESWSSRVRGPVQKGQLLQGGRDDTRTWAALAVLVAAAVAAAVVAGSVRAASKGRLADHDRLGVRQQGQHGAVRRACAGRREDPRQPAEQPRAASTAGSCGSSPATRRTTTRRRRSRVRRALLGQGAHVIFTTCDVDFATPVVQEAINRGVLAVAPCIGTDQMGPKRFGAKGRLAFSFGNVAQDEGSAMAEYAWRKGWRTASLATNTLLVYFKNVVQAFEKRFTQLGGKIVARESYATGANNVQNAVSRLNSAHGGRDRDGDGVRRAAGARRRACARSATDTPILNSWAGDGTYWIPEGPAGHELLRRHVCVGLRRRSEQGRPTRWRSRSRRAPAASSPAPRRSTASPPRSGVPAARRAASGSPRSWRSSRTCRRCRASSASRSQLHTVFGRQYRVIRIQDNKARYVGAVRAKVVPKI